MTLLFFLERLLDKGEPRSVHDLSCQFGNKEFTKEMRQIAGGSQSGMCSIHISTSSPSRSFLSAMIIQNNEKLMHNIVLGLKKFLGQYPSIFMVNGDYVRLNTYQNANPNEGGSGGQRDYQQEARDYFKNKLLQYGVGVEVPVRSLLGHRSQASPQVRHISGTHISDTTNTH